MFKLATNPMFYEMQFQSKKAPRLDIAPLPYCSIESIENIPNAIVIFDESKNCLFLNKVAKQILGDRTNISVIGDWIREKIQNSLQDSVIFKLSELPLKTTSIEQERAEEIEVLLRKLYVSDEFERELNEYESLVIREPKDRTQPR